MNMDLLVVSIVESAVSNAEICLEIVSVRVFLVAFKNSKSCDEISLLQEMRNIWEFVFFLL